MPKSLMLLPIFIGLYTSLMAQDLIFKLDDSTIEAQVIRVEKDRLVFRALNSGTEQQLSRDSIRMVAYESGMKQYFEVVSVDGAGDVVALSSVSSANEMFQQGRRDAKHQYKGQGPLLGTMLPTAIYPPAGLAAGAVIAAVPPKVDRDQIADTDLFKNPNYVAGYNRRMRGKKIKATALGFLGGVMVFIGWVAAITG